MSQHFIRWPSSIEKDHNQTYLQIPDTANTMGFGYIKDLIRRLYRGKQEVWIDHATPESILQDVTNIILHDDLDLQRFKENFKKGPETIPPERIIAAISQNYSYEAKRLLPQVTPLLLSILGVHARFPFLGRREDLTSGSLLRSLVLVTQRSLRLFDGPLSYVINGVMHIIRRQRTDEDALRLIFWGLALQGTHDMQDLDAQLQETYLLDVLSLVQKLHPPLISNFLDPAREHWLGLANRLGMHLPTPRVASKIDGEVFGQWSRFIDTFSTTMRSFHWQEVVYSDSMPLYYEVEHLEAKEAPEEINWEHFVEYAESVHLLDLMDVVFGGAFDIPAVVDMDQDME